MTAAAAAAPATPAAPTDFAALERRFLARRATGEPDVPGAVREAFATTIDPAGAARSEVRRLRDAALAVAAAVERHGAQFPPGQEPAYHDRHHQAEAVLAMGALCRAAHGTGSMDLGPEEAALGILAMAGHDLLHDGSADSIPSDRLERRSAEATTRIVAAAGLAPTALLARLEAVILATEFSPATAAAPFADPLCRLAREADLCASLMPELGWRLSRALAAEWRRAGLACAGAPATHAGHLALLRGLPPPTPAAERLGLAASLRAQIAAFAAVAQRLDLPEASPEAGAAALDRMAAGPARARYRAALRGVLAAARQAEDAA